MRDIFENHNTPETISETTQTLFEGPRMNYRVELTEDRELIRMVSDDVCMTTFGTIEFEEVKDFNSKRIIFNAGNMGWDEYKSFGARLEIFDPQSYKDINWNLRNLQPKHMKQVQEKINEIVEILSGNI